MIPDIGGPKNRHYLVENRENWPGIFRDWLQTAVDDDMVIEGDLTDEEESDVDDEDDEEDEDENHPNNPQEMEDIDDSSGTTSSNES